MVSLIETAGARNAGNRREIKVLMVALRLNKIVEPRAAAAKVQAVGKPKQFLSTLHARRIDSQ